MMQNIEKHPSIQTIEEIEKAYPDEWLEIEITKWAEDGFTALEGRLIAHGKDRDKVSEEALKYFRKYDVKDVYHAYTGEIQAESVLL